VKSAGKMQVATSQTTKIHNYVRKFQAIIKIIMGLGSVASKISQIAV
jgi:hypothetical protein